MPRITFLTTIYNKERHLPATLRSIAAQTGVAEAEYIFVDDGSKDRSREVVETITASWPNTTIISQKNQGPSVATNVGLERATGDYVKLVDGDDILLPNATDVLLEALTKTGAKLAFGYNAEFPAEHPPEHLSPVDAPAIRLRPNLLRFLLQRQHFGPSHMLIDRRLFQEVGGCDEAIFTQDYAMLFRLARKTDFAEVDAVVALSPDVVPGRVQTGAQLYHDMNLALQTAVRDGLSRSLNRYAFQRAAGRAWKWATRHGGAGLTSPYFWLYAMSYLPVPLWPDVPHLIGATLPAYHSDPNIRRSFPRLAPPPLADQPA